MSRLLSNLALLLFGISGCLHLGLATALAADGEDEKTTVLVGELIADRDREVSDKLAPLRQQYSDGLEKFRMEWIAANRGLDALAALKLAVALEENTSLDLPRHELDSLPPELQRVVEAWNATHGRILEEANSNVAEKFKSMRTQAVVDGDLDTAQELDRQLTLLKPSHETPPMAQAPDDGDEDLPPAWTWGSGGTLRLLPDGTAIHSRWRGQKGSWEWTRHRRAALTNPINHEVSKIRFNRDWSGAVFDPAGRSTTLTPLEEVP